MRAVVLSPRWYGTQVDNGKLTSPRGKTIGREDVAPLLREPCSSACFK